MSKNLDLRMPAGSGRALVLGGGGSAGNAWEIGVLAGLFEAGLDVTGADLIIGTSAGSTAAAQLGGATPTELLAAVLAPAPQPPQPLQPLQSSQSAQPPQSPQQAQPAQPAQPRPGPAGSGGGRVAQGQAVDPLERTNRIIAASKDAADMRRRMGTAALEMEAASDGSWQTRWRATVAARLPNPRWPERNVLITAVDARTGEPVVFDRHGGIDLVDAVAASCSSGFPYGIGENRYIDGGYRRNENADLAAGYARVLVLSPFGGRTRHPPDWGMQLAAQIDELRAGGSRVETIFPDGDSLGAFGSNMMDPSTRPPSARAGYNQGKALAGQLTGFWR